MERQETYIIFSANYPPHIGGVERYTCGLKEELVRRGKRVVIVTSSMPGEPDHSQEPRTDIYRIPSRYFLADSMPVMLPFGAWNRVLKEILPLPDKKVIVQTMLYPMSLFAVSFAHKHHLPCLVISHGSNYARLGDSLVSRFEHLYEHVLMYQAQKKTDYFYTVSQSGAEWLKTFRCNAKGVLYNSVDDAAISRIPDDHSVSFRRKYQISADETVITFVGRLIKEKGLQQLLDAFRELLKEHDHVTLAVVGDGEMMPVLKTANCEKIICTGALPHGDTIRVLQESDCFCLPSDSEGFPTTVLEAVLSRCYVITAPYGGAKEIISDRSFGYVMDGNTADDIYRAFSFYLSHPEECADAVNAAYQRFYDGFTWRSTCDALELAFQNI